MQIKRQQQEQMKSLRDNPVKFQELLKLADTKLEERGGGTRGAGLPAGLSLRGTKGPVGAAALPLPPTFGQKPAAAAEAAAGPSGRRRLPGHEAFRRSRDDDLNEGMTGRGATYEREERDLARGFRGHAKLQDNRNGSLYERGGERHERDGGRHERNGKRDERDGGRHERGGERYDRHGGRYDKDADRERLRDARDTDRVRDERRLEARGRDRDGDRDARPSGRGAEREREGLREAEPSGRRTEREDRGSGRDGRESRKEDRTEDRRGKKQEGERNGDGEEEPSTSAGAAARRQRGGDDEEERRGADK
ncbi:hypothetical protein DUNSADRAFT_18422 [Dunaliella salina]|uniref:Uncharacterized protein n=1 Tax=Dunaliella salina TaxID=3046 RepID=A0ABQ7GZ81_DUNSA|nr:hypothetical protein DUNSADRAFT_18422 [Dunaliella salina]|eukprot:KAF5839879.1 hypothetical protein DUNSADRAFT_18422 [Dunaliella salina]